MVATAMAGIRITGQTMVRLNSAFKLYLVMALLSLLLACAWQSMRLPSTTPQGFMMQFYRHVLGHLDGRSCPSYPVCSTYAQQALLQYGWLWGSWLTIDRLIHEADDLKKDSSKRHMIVFESEKRLYDPLSRNDFWLNKERERQ